jgi:hypothetical protein
MGRRLPAFVLLAAALCPVPAWSAGAMVTEVFTIGYRPVDEMIQILRPMVPRPGSVSGAYGKIVVRTTPDNMREVKEILASLNQAPANLLISVRYSMNEEVRRDLYEAFGEIGGDTAGISAGRSADGGRGLVIRHEDAGVRIDQRQGSGTDAGTQRVRVLEGKEAFIGAGRSVPVTEERVVTSGSGVTTVQRSTGFRSVDNGFYVRARLQGSDRVSVEVFPQHNRLAGDSRSIDVREASTVVSSPLGRWMEIGGVDSASKSSTREIGAASDATRNSDYITYLKVDRLDR